MRKSICLIMIIVSLMFMMPFIFLNKRTLTVSKEPDAQKEELQTIDYDYSKYSTIKLLHQDTDVVEEVTNDRTEISVADAQKRNPAYQAGDVIEIREKSRSLQRYKDIIEVTGGRLVPAWLDVDHENLKGTVKNLPTREEIDEAHFLGDIGDRK